MGRVGVGVEEAGFRELKGLCFATGSKWSKSGSYCLWAQGFHVLATALFIATSGPASAAP